MTKVAALGRGVQSIEVGQRLLAGLVESGRPMTLRDLAAAAALAPAQAHAYLASFRRIELVEQDAATGLYSLGPSAMRLGMSRMQSHARLAEASATASELCARLGLMVCVVVWGPDAPTVVQVQEGVRPLYLNIREGTVFSVTGTASGRVFGAFADKRLVRSRIETELSSRVVGQNPDSRLTERELAAGFATIRSQGYALTHGRPVPGVNAAAAPVFDADSSLVAVLTVIGTDATLPLGDNDPALRLLLAETARISKPPQSRAASVGSDDRRPAESSRGR